MNKENEENGEASLGKRWSGESLVAQFFCSLDKSNCELVNCAENAQRQKAQRFDSRTFLKDLKDGRENLRIMR